MKRMRIALAVTVVVIVGALILRLAEAPVLAKQIWLYGGAAAGALCMAWACYSLVGVYYRRAGIIPAAPVQEGPVRLIGSGNEERRRRRNRRSGSR